MASVAGLFQRAMGLHRQAVAHLMAAEAELQARLGDRSAAEAAAATEQQAAGQAGDAAGRAVVAWCELRFDELSPDRPLGELPADEPMYVRIGDARPVPDQVFSVALPFLAGGHIAIDTDVRDARVAAWFRGILLRVVAAVADGAVRVLPVDGATMGEVVGAFQPLIGAEAWRPAATTAEGLRAALDEAEKQVAAVRAGGGRGGCGGGSRPPRTACRPPTDSSARA